MAVLEAGGSEHFSLSCHFQAAMFLNVCFFTCKMGIITSHRAVVRIKLTFAFKKSSLVTNSGAPKLFSSLNIYGPFNCVKHCPGF